MHEKYKNLYFLYFIRLSEELLEKKWNNTRFYFLEKHGVSLENVLLKSGVKENNTTKIYNF